MIPLPHILVVSALLFTIGLYGILARRNLVLVLISAELMLNAVNINFVAFSLHVAPQAAAGQMYTLFAIASGAAEIGLGLAILLALYRCRETSDSDTVNTLKW
jgi:NADH:ubiquinone oxidoreductase subunit K